MWVLISLIICVILAIICKRLYKKYEKYKRASWLWNISLGFKIVAILLNSFLIISIIIRMHTSGFIREYEFINMTRQDTSCSDVERVITYKKVLKINQEIMNNRNRKFLIFKNDKIANLPLLK